MIGLKSALAWAWAGPKNLWKALYDENKELPNAFAEVALKLGRIPEPGQFERLDELNQRLGSPKRALRAYAQGGDSEVTWEEMRRRFGIGQPAKRRWETLYEEYSELLESFWSLMLQLGRLPEPEEFSRAAELREKIGLPKQALRVFVQKGGGDTHRNAIGRSTVPAGHPQAG